MLAAAGPDPGLRSLLEAFIYPLAESIGHDDGVSWYARFLRQVAFAPGFDAFEPSRAEICRGLHAVIAGLTAHLGHLPVQIRDRRLLQMAQLVVHSLADHESHLAKRVPTLPTPLLVADLVDCAEAVLLAPVSADTRAELAHSCTKEA